MSNIQVFSDFDGTITVRDTVDVLLSKLADPEWETIEEQWVRGEIGSRECMARQIPLIRGGWKAVREILDTVEIDPYFADFAAWCRDSRIPLVVVSDGLDRVIGYVLDKHRVRVDRIYANQLIETAGQLSLRSHAGPRVAGCGSGVCKCKIVNDSSPTTRVVIGDGRSDFCWSRHADLLFAKSKLAEFCRKEKVAANEFNNFAFIKAAIESLSRGSSGSLVFNTVPAAGWQPVVT